MVIQNIYDSFQEFNLSQLNCYTNKTWYKNRLIIVQ